MPSYLHPGVYVEEIPSGSKPIEAVGTSTAVFIGFCPFGPLDEPIFITSWEDYQNLFGGFREVPSASSDPDDYMGRAVYAYFLNGGSKAYILRTAEGTAAASANLSGSSNNFPFKAKYHGSWAENTKITFTAQDTTIDDPAQALLDIEVLKTKPDPSDASLDITVFEETFSNVSLDVSSPRFINRVFQSESLRLGETTTLNRTEATEALAAINAGGTSGVTITLTGGNDGSVSGALSYGTAISALKKVRDANILLLPDIHWDDGANGTTIYGHAIQHCQSMKNRMVIVELAPDTTLADAGNVTALSLPTSTYSALYYPWPKVPNPFFDAERNPTADRLVPSPPSAYAAGQWAKTDSQRGVWKAPAGVGNNLLGLSKLSEQVEDAEQDFLNPLGVNALRQLPNYGAVIWGARTLATKADPEWRYIPVRRTAMFVEESIYNGIHWAVFEPNDHRLWSALRTNIESFLNGLFRSGAFQGQKSSDAYFVRCGLGQTMTQADIDRGQVIVQVGFAPLKPAEFVIVRIQQKVGQQ